MTEPPPPRQRARTAVILSAIGLVLMVGAIAWQVFDRGHVAGSYDAGAALREMVGRILRVVSALFIIAGTFVAVTAFKAAKLPSTVALLFSVTWLGWLLWLWLG